MMRDGLPSFAFWQLKYPLVFRLSSSNRRTEVSENPIAWRPTMADREDSTNPKAIAQISVDRLFGNRTYLIPPPDVDPKRMANLLLLYGDNGSGKTTILRMLYSLLSPARGGGFKSLLARTPFASFSVTFADRTSLAAVRPGGQL